MAFLAGNINHVLRPKIEALLAKVTRKPETILLWDEFQSMNRFSGFPSIPIKTAVSIGRYAITIVPGVGLLFTAFITGQPTMIYSSGEIVLLVIAIIAEILIVTSAFYVAWLFLAKIPAKARFRWKFPESLVKS